MKKKQEIHRTQNIADNDKVSTEIEILEWVLAQSLSVRKRLGNDGLYYY